MKIYFAHPYFTESQIAVADKIKNILSEIEAAHPDVTILNPFDFSPNIEGDRDAKRRMSPLVVAANESLLDDSDLVLALIDDRDTGVIWEMGYARSNGTSVITISDHDYDLNIMLSGTVLAHITHVTSDIGRETLTSCIESLLKLRSVR